MTRAITQFRSLTKRRSGLKTHGKKAFWVWVTYQTIKGTLTTSLIWVPLILAYWNQ